MGRDGVPDGSDYRISGPDATDFEEGAAVASNGRGFLVVFGSDGHVYRRRVVP